ncbi:MAG: glycosyltransferase family 2 protein [Ginsengibacter sp.]
MKISVIIPVKNGAQTLEKCLSSIRNQTTGNTEIIILDSMSEDGSREIATKYNAKIVQIVEGTFNHGLTRNIGTQQATGDFLFYTVQDAWISENDLLEKMAKHFDDEKVMGVTGHQAVPHEKDKNPMLWYHRFSEPKMVIREVQDVQQFKRSAQSIQRSLIAWDDVVAMYRKSALIEQPFVETQFAEDWIWSRDALLRGWKLMYDPSLVVYHYHHSGYSYAYKVAYAVNYHFYKYFNFKPNNSGMLMHLVRTTYQLLKNPNLTIKEKLYWMCYNYRTTFGTINSRINFLFHKYMGGIKSVEKRYHKVCKIIPQGNHKEIR